MYKATARDVVRRDLFGPAPDPRDRPYRFVDRLVLVVFTAFGFRFDIRGSEHVPLSGGAIISSNHVSFFDFMFLGLGALPRHRLVRFMAKSAVFHHWFSGPFMRAMQHIPVDRKAGAAAFESAVRALKDGEVVGVFPEATISTSFTVKDLKAGAARMAADAGVPIIPAAVWGGHRIATKGHKVQLRRGVPVTVILGEPIVAEPGGRPPSPGPGASRSSPNRGSGPSPSCGAPARRWRSCSTRPSAATPTSPPGRRTGGGCRPISAGPHPRPRRRLRPTRSAPPAGRPSPRAGRCGPGSPRACAAAAESLHDVTLRRPAPSAGRPPGRRRTSGEGGPAGPCPAGGTPPSTPRCPAGRRRRPPAAPSRTRARSPRGPPRWRSRVPRSRGAGASRPPPRRPRSATA